MSSQSAPISRNETAEVLLMLTSFSLRVQKFTRAVFYGRVAHSLFPEDVAIAEMYAYALLLMGENEQAHKVVSKVTAETANLSLLRARLSILRKEDRSEQSSHLRKYLLNH